MTKQQRVLDIELERLLLGELDNKRMGAVSRALEEDSEIKARYLALQASNDAILEQYPSRVMAVEIAERSGRREEEPRRTSRIWMAVPAMAVAATAVMLAILVTPPEVVAPRVEKPEVILTKGDRDPALFVFRKDGDHEERLKEGAEADSGDMIQLKYAARGASHGVILSIDGLGMVTLHLPSDETRSTELDKRATHVLGFAYELDDAPEFERFFFVTADKPIAVKQVLAKARALGANKRGRLELDKGFQQSDFMLKKTPRAR